jgi:hypothetical protein
MRKHAFARHGQSLPRQPRLELLEARLLLTLGAALTTPVPGTSAAISAAYGQLPMSFEPNQGQTDSTVSFLTRGPGYALFLTPNEAVLSLQPLAAANSFAGAIPTAPAADVLRMQLIGANSAPSAVGLDALAGKSNYLIGNDPSQWHTDVPNFGGVEEHGVYPGVDLVYYGNQRQLEYDFDVAPGTDPGVIRLAFQGAESMALDAQGNLLLHTSGGDVVEQAPVLYQASGGVRQVISGHYVLGDNGQVGFAVGAYDSSKTLVIDPTLSYSTYLGGNGTNVAFGIAVDGSGDAYLAGYTDAANFPTANPIQPVNGGGGLSVAFVAKFNAAGTALVYSTYLGGSGSDGDEARAIAVDSSGDAYVAGQAYSKNFPTVNAFQPASGGALDAFVTKIDAAGSALVYSTYLGGSGNDEATGIAVDAAGNAYVTGNAGSTDFPTANPLQPAHANDAFVTKLNATGSALVYSSYLGGEGGAESNGIAVDPAGNAYVTGATAATDFPTVNAIQPNLGGSGLGVGNAFVSKINAAGSGLVYSTYLGGSNLEIGFGIAADTAGNAYVTGWSSSANFPTVNALQVVVSDGTHAFVSAINATGSALRYSTRLGGTGIDLGFGIAVDSAGDAFVTGSTSSSDFPTVNPTETFNGSDDNAFVSELNVAGSALLFSTYLGGTGSRGSDHARAIAVDADGNAYVTGITDSTTFPTANPIQPALVGFVDTFVTKIVPGQTLGSSETSLSSSPDTSTISQQVTFTSTVTVPPGASAATGTVNFLEGTAMLGTGTLNGAGVATFSTSSLAAGIHLITAAYEGDGSLAASVSSPVVVTINAVTLKPTVTTLTALPTAADFGRLVTFATVVSEEDSSAGPSSLDNDEVLFTIDGSSSIVQLRFIDGQDIAALSTATLTPGVHSVAAAFAGDSTFAASTSPAVRVTIGAAPTTTTLSARQVTAMAGQPLSFTVIVGQPNPDPELSGDLITGLVTFSIDGQAGSPVSLQDVNDQKIATLTTSSLAAGTHILTASFGGNGTFASSVSNTLMIIINSPTPTPTPTPTPPSIVASDGPLVMNLRRFGFHAQPTVLVLTFSKDLNVTTANNTANYKIVPIGPHGKFGAAIAISRIAYDPAGQTVTLHPSHRLNVHERFELIVDGTSKHAVTDLALDSLDGGHTGKSGSDYVGKINWSTLDGPSLRGKKFVTFWLNQQHRHGFGS